MSIAVANPFSRRTGWVLWAAWLVILAVWTGALVTTYPVQVKQQVMPNDRGIPTAKLLHVAAYAFLTGFGAFLPLRGHWRWLPVLVMSLHGFGTEFCQLFVPLRTGSLTDVAIDHCGILLGLFCTLKWWLPSR